MKYRLRFEENQSYASVRAPEVEMSPLHLVSSQTLSDLQRSNTRRFPSFTKMSGYINNGVKAISKEQYRAKVILRWGPVSSFTEHEN